MWPDNEKKLDTSKGEFRNEKFRECENCLIIIPLRLVGSQLLLPLLAQVATLVHINGTWSMINSTVVISKESKLKRKAELIQHMIPS